MKKVLIGFAAVIAIVLFGGSHFLNSTYEKVMDGEKYYVKITTDGSRLDGKDDAGREYTDYSYDLKGYDKDGMEKELQFRANKTRPLRKNAYLKITWNKEKGVTMYEEVKKNEVPDKVATKLG
ncbi:YxeA family protein [Enterococcus sp. DIV0756]|uniref:YxeA family protein n=1 Tax=Enterococcus sp. DIV0756 TaxID=2774636 RepID=UPI003F263DFA